MVTHDKAQRAPSTASDAPTPAPAVRPHPASIPARRPHSIGLDLVYAVDSVEKTDPPGGAAGQDWYRYVLRNLSSTICGLRRGSRETVTDYAAQYTEQLNARIVHGQPHWHARSERPKPPGD